MKTLAIHQTGGGQYSITIHNVEQNTHQYLAGCLYDDRFMCVKAWPIDDDQLRVMAKRLMKVVDECDKSNETPGKSSSQLRDELRARVSPEFEKKPSKEVDLGSVANQIMHKIHPYCWGKCCGLM